MISGLKPREKRQALLGVQLADCLRELRDDAVELQRDLRFAPVLSLAPTSILSLNISLFRRCTPSPVTWSQAN